MSEGTDSMAIPGLVKDMKADGEKMFGGKVVEKVEEQTKPEPEPVDPNMIHIKVAAGEVHKQSRMTRNVGLLGIASTVLTAIFMTAGPWAGAGAACILSFFLVFMVGQAIKRMTQLRRDYGLAK